MKKVKKWLKRLFFFIPILTIIIVALQIWSVPDYRYGESYVSYSPDGKYKLDHIFPLNSYTDVRVITNLSRNTVVAIVPTPNLDVISMRPSWLCSKEFPDGFYRRGPCYGHKLEAGDSDIPTLRLPPSLWRQLHAWLTIKFKDLENPQLKIIEISSRYPPVTKK